MRPILPAFCVLAAVGLVATAQPAWAQFNRSSAQVSGTARTSSTMRSGSSSMFGSGSRTGGTSSGTRSYLTSSQTTGARQPGQFVGADTRDVQDFRSMIANPQQAQQAVQQWRSGLTSLGSTRGGQPTQPSGRLSTAYGRGFGRSGAGEISAAVRLGFSMPTPPADQSAAATLQQVQKDGRLQTIGAIQVVVEQGVAVLRGAVASPHDRSLAEQLVRLEPGVRQVRNELEVAPQPADAENSLPVLTPNP